MTEHQLVGLRFTRADARVLRNIVTNLRSLQPVGIDISLYEKAADSAAEGEPLVVAFTDRSEIDQMVAAFAQLGVGRPAIDELNGSLGR